MLFWSRIAIHRSESQRPGPFVAVQGNCPRGWTWVGSQKQWVSYTPAAARKLSGTEKAPLPTHAVEPSAYSNSLPRLLGEPSETRAGIGYLDQLQVDIIQAFLRTKFSPTQNLGKSFRTADKRPGPTFWGPSVR